MTSAVLAPTASGRSHHLPAAAASVVAIGLLVALPVLLDDLGRLAAVLVLQLALVLAWVLLTGASGFAGALGVGVLAAVSADLVVVLTDDPALGVLLAVLGLVFLASAVQQMVRRRRSALVDHLAAELLLCVVVTAMAAWLLLGAAGAGDRMQVAALSVGAALVAGHLVDWVLPRPVLVEGVPRGLLGLAVAMLAGAAVGMLAVEVSGGLGAGPSEPAGPAAAAAFGAALGAVAGLVGIAASFLVADVDDPPVAGPVVDDAAPSADPLGGWAAPVLQVVLPVAVCAPVALALHVVL